MSTADKIHYCSIYIMIVTGFYVSSYGPLIPFYSKATGLDQTHFSYIFFVRSIANILGGSLIKTLFRLFKIKSLLIIMLSAMSLSLLVCSFSASTPNLVINLFIGSINYVMLSIVVISFNFIIFQKEQAQKKIQILGFLFGLGAFLGPFFIMFLQLAAYKFLSVAILLLVPFYYKLPLPEININYGTVKQTNIISRKSELLVCGLMLIHSTLEIGIGSWIPTYAIKAGITSIERSGIYSMLFWLPNCIFRLIWIYIPLDFHSKLKLIVYSLAGSTTILLLLQSFDLYQAVCIFGPLTTGILLSNLYVFILAIPTQNGYQFTGSNSANLVMANSLGQGLLITPIGYSLSYFGFKSFVVIEWLFAILMCYIHNMAMQSLQRKNVQQTSIKLLDSQSCEGQPKNSKQ